MKQVPQLAKKARVYDGTAWQELATAQTDLTAYSTTAQMNTAITAGVGLVPILTQTIGTAVSSITVSNVFSATYDNYLITLSGGVASTTTGLNLTLGATATGYYRGGNFTSYTGTTVSGINSSNASSWLSASLGTTTSSDGRIELYDPFLTKNTKIRASYVSTVTNGESYVFGGFLNDSTSYTAFTFTPSTGGATLTGGTIRVYGYKN